MGGWMGGGMGKGMGARMGEGMLVVPEECTFPNPPRDTALLPKPVSAVSTSFHRQLHQDRAALLFITS